MAKITIDYDQTKSVVGENEINSVQARVDEAHTKLHNGTGKGSDFLGWLNWPNDYHQSEEFKKVKQAGQKIQQDSEVLIVIGIGGSYLGARAVIEALESNFFNLLPKDKPRVPQVLFAGNNISGKYLNDLIEVIRERDFSINVVSKSGTTLEPAVAFHILKKILEERYGKEKAKGRIYVTTDRNKGALKELATSAGYETFVVPDNVGGRYSVLTAVGLLPIAAAGINVDELIAGAKEGVDEYAVSDLRSNPAYLYAVLRHLLYQKGKKVEILANFEPNLIYLSEWWKQLFGESEGKDGRGIFPASVTYSTDLHSLGQYIQEGERHLFETFINIEQPLSSISVNGTEDNLDELNYLAGKSLDSINKKVYEAVRLAHTDGDVPNLSINMPKLDEFHLGKLIYFFEKSCALSGYLLGANPFNQGGVEAYKQNMFALLGKS